MKKRPERLSGETVKVEACGTVFITVNTLDNKPYEVFMQGSKLATCRSNLEAVARCISKLLQSGELEEAIDAIEKIRCPAMSRKIGGEAVKKEKDITEIPWSCPDALAKELGRHKKK